MRQVEVKLLIQCGEIVVGKGMGNGCEGRMWDVIKKYKS